MPTTINIVHLPDSQRQTAAMSAAQAQWIVDHLATNSIALVTHVGDLVEDANDDTHWSNIRSALELTYNLGIPIGILPGNHDIYNTAKYKTNFPLSNWAGKSWYGGAPPDELSTYQLFTVGSQAFAHLALKYGPTHGGATLTWAAALMPTFRAANRQVIISTHSFLELNGTFTPEGQIIYDDLIVPNVDLVPLVFCGHRHGVAYVRATNGDYTTDMFLADYQDEDVTCGGLGYMRLCSLTI